MFKLNEDSLGKQPLFLCAIFVPIFVFIVTGYFAWSDKTIDLSSTGFNHFLEISKLPLGILSLSIPFVAIVAHIHRTIQTAKQIELTNEKNVTDRFYAHHKYITESLSKISSEKFSVNDEYITLNISSPFLLYRDIYPNASPSDGINHKDKSELFIKIIKSLQKIDETLNKSEATYKLLPSLPAETQVLNLGEILNSIYSIAKDLHISKEVINLPNKYVCLLKFMSVKIKLVTTLNSEDQLKDYISAIYSIANKIFDIFQVDNIPPLIAINHYINKGKKYHFHNIFPKFVYAEKQSIQLAIGEHVFNDEEYEHYELSLGEALSSNV
ncbi:hypothetical protein [Serratia marcescens]|uniref:hypothetical protein n=1 Tax=Serratia marcescens TaxID=615 RepID=UPI00146A588A|nr:hypothetical protein [Serratia marcescens]NMU40136.1 hypothetical protein [Serratia marcescens]